MKRGGGVAELERLRAFTQRQRAAAQPVQQAEEQPSRDADVSRDIGFKRKDGIGHERSLLLRGWLCSGTRFSHSLSACQ